MSQNQTKRILVAGGGGFIGGHLAGSLLAQGHQVVVADIKSLDQWYQVHENAENHVLNLEEKESCYRVMEGCDEVYNLACNMGGMGFIEFNRALCMISVLINTHLLMGARDLGVKRFFYASSACVYPDYRQDDADVMALKESDAYPAQPEDGYGWEKLFSERMCRNFHEDFGSNDKHAPQVVPDIRMARKFVQGRSRLDQFQQRVRVMQKSRRKKIVFL